MSELKRTTKNGRGNFSHTHIVYLRDDGTGVTSEDSGHVHEVIMSEGKSDFIIIPSEEGSKHHTHEIAGDLKRKKLENKKSDSDLVDQVLKLYKSAKDIDDKYIKKGKEAYDFYKGIQWAEEAKKKLEEENRPALVINHIEPTINALLGISIQDKTDFEFLPIENSDQILADTLNVLTKRISAKSNLHIEETDVKRDKYITGRGLFNVYIDFDKDIRGNIVVERFPWNNVYVGPHIKKDLSDAEYLIKWRWYSEDKVKSMFPEKAEDLSPEMSEESGEISRKADVPDQYRVPGVAKKELYNSKKKEYKIIELWKKEFFKIYMLVNEDGFVFNGSGIDINDIKKIASIEGFKKIRRTVEKMRVTIIACDQLLSDEYPDLAVNDFHIVPDYATFIDGEWYGKVENLKDVQREINKRHSQLIDIVNKVANYLYYYDDQTFDSIDDAKAFEKDVNKPGASVKVRDVNKKPVKEEGVKFPGEIVQAYQLSAQKIMEISLINPEMMGLNSNASSGVAILQRKQSALTGNEFLSENSKLAKSRLGKLLAANIGKYYDSERIIRIIENENYRQEGKLKIGNQNYDQLKEGYEKIVERLKDKDLTDYDVQVSEKDYSPTTRRALFLIWTELAKSGMQIPPSLLIQYSDVKDKEKVLQQFEQIQAQQAQMEQSKQNTEIQKTMIAQQGKQGAV